MKDSSWATRNKIAKLWVLQETFYVYTKRNQLERIIHRVAQLGASFHGYRHFN